MAASKRTREQRQTRDEPLSRSKISFSFEFYDTGRAEYCLSGWTSEEIRATLSRLRELSGKNMKELATERATFHFYETDWSRTVEPNGFADPRVNVLDPFHFALLGVNGQRARVYGALAGDIFYIVWFDHDHKIWPTFKRHN